MFPFADVRGALVEAEQARHPSGDARADWQKFAVEVSTDLRLPEGRRVEAMVIARREVDDAVEQHGALLPLFQRFDVTSAEVLVEFRAQERLQAVRHALHLLQVCLAGHRAVVENATIARWHDTVRGD